MFEFNRGVGFSGVSIYASEAMDRLTVAGWVGEFDETGIALRSGRLRRLIPYSDSLGSLVYKDDAELMVMLGKRRH